MSNPTLKTENLVSQWLNWDPNAETRQEIQDLFDRGDNAELSKRLDRRIEFGTAGLRGAMKAGFAYMNNLVVIQTSQGLAMHLQDHVTDAKSRGIVIGYDSRRNSEAYAKCTAACFAHQGFTVYLYSEVVATPLLAYSVPALNAAAGVVITASHNPKDDNGYKVYWSNGAQIIEPRDIEIRSYIDKALVPWKLPAPSHAEALEGPYKHLVRDPKSVLSSYFSKIKCWSFHLSENRKRSLRITYTAMHGVGTPYVVRAFEAYNLQPFIPTEQQVNPDSEFPTVTFPNPEEGKGALKLAIETADAHQSPVVIANDPDADRLAAAEKQPNGCWKIFTGNELGILLADWVSRNYLRVNPNTDRSKLVVASSTVSSKMLKALAEREGFEYGETLTGFKWIGNLLYDAKKNGKTPLFAFEESIGYMVGDVCWDKDGIHAAAVFGEMASYYYDKGSTCELELQRMRKELGFYMTKNSYFFCYEPILMERIFKNIRNSGDYIKNCGGFKVAGIRDLTLPGFDSTREDKLPTLPMSASTQMITFTFEDGVVTLRGSGTEPKLKYYVEVVGKDEESSEKKLKELTEAIINELLKPDEYGLFWPKE
ncbi:probable phosphoglucomutase-2 [Schistocerca gregaria]|uniref:probable phosphoglucomutase-2 n=1 Tax=Schistocerca gregaria TaxID=7010 RepID=UPI00211ED224|nr:probable phosphoglucomutase-2 [Schistocerca gregaria]